MIEFARVTPDYSGAARVLSRSFAFGFLVLVAAGLVALAVVPQDDFKNVPDDATCLRLARRADFVVVFANVGGSSLRLLLEFRVGGLEIFSERVHRSTTMSCTAHRPPRKYSEVCTDAVLVFKRHERVRAVASFDYVNDHVAAAQGDYAAMLGLDGTIRLGQGVSHFVTTTHFCTAALQPGTNSLELEIVDQRLQTTRSNLAEFRTELAKAHCNSTQIWVFPPEAANERVTWLSLSTNFVYDYADDVLSQRRRVLEIGQSCANSTPALRHVERMYRMDCAVIGPEWCRSQPALTFRRMATSTLRLDVNGTAARLHAEDAGALTRLPLLLPRSEALWLAAGRLMLMLLTALAMFVRGSQKTSTTKHALANAVARVHGRHSRHIPETPTEVLVDVSITFLAFAVRAVVCGMSARTLIDDGLWFAVVLDITGICASALHVILRYIVLVIDLSRESPLTKLAGPMSVIDCCMAVLVSFSEAPILSVDSGRFAAIGRLLISILSSVAIVGRCTFAFAICLLLAHTCVTHKDYAKECYGFQTVLRIAAVCWLVQGTVASALIATLFANPAAWALTRSLDTNVGAVPYAVFLGLVCVSLPTLNRNSTRLLKQQQKLT